MAYDAAMAYAGNVRNTIGENEGVHQAYDMQSVNTMLDCIMPILEERLGGQAGAYTYQGSKVIEGMNSYRLAQEGDATGIAVNPIRDTIFASNPELYYTLGEISTTVALSTPSIAGSMSIAVKLGVSPTRAALTEMGMLGSSDIAGRYVQAGVYEETGDLRLANMARSGTSLLVYGGLAYADARMGMSGIRQWRPPKVDPLEFQPPEQTFPESTAPLYQGKSSTYPAIPGSMTREDIEAYVSSLRNGSAQGLTAAEVYEAGNLDRLLKPDQTSGPERLGLGNLDGGVEGGSSTLNDWVNRIPELEKQAPIEIPSNATVKVQVKNGYDQISFRWTENGQNYEVRWHTKTPGAPEGQGNTWVVSRVTPGTPTGQIRTEHILVGDTWIPKYQWQDAINAYRNGTATQEQLQLLKDGHWQAP